MQEMKLQDLKTKSPTELLSFAEEVAVENASAMRKQELMFGAIAVDGFRGLEHAMELVTAIGGVRFVNDSKATNVESALRSIRVSGHRDLVPIIGGRFKGGDLALLRQPLHTRAAAVVAIGEARALVRAALEDAVPVHEADKLPSPQPRSLAPTSWRSRRAWCCSPPRARASTCSRTMQSGGTAIQGGGGATRGGSVAPANGRRDVSCEQSSVG